MRIAPQSRIPKWGISSGSKRTAQHGCHKNRQQECPEALQRGRNKRCSLCTTKSLLRIPGDVFPGSVIDYLSGRAGPSRDSSIQNLLIVLHHTGLPSGNTAYLFTNNCPVQTVHGRSPGVVCLAVSPEIMRRIEPSHPGARMYIIHAHVSA